MIPYYLFMGLLLITLILWAVIALRDEGPSDSPPGGDSQDPHKKM